MNAHGIDTKIFTKQRDTHLVDEDASTTVVRIRSGAVARIRQLVSSIRNDRGRLHHVELYVGGRFAFLYALISRLMKVPVLVVERGDLLFCIKKVYPLTMRISIHLCYALATRIWAKELYMARYFEGTRARHKTFLLANAVPMPEEMSNGERDIDFLWVNRLIPERHPDWFVDVADSLQETRPFVVHIAGVLPPPQAYGTQEMQDYVSKKAAQVGEWLTLHPFGDPSALYRRARFFVLPADVVFANFALLEAMARGVVPVTFDVEGASLIVDDGRNGILVPPGKAPLLAGLKRALELDPHTWRAMSDEAKRTVEERFSVDSWGQKLVQQHHFLTRPAALRPRYDSRVKAAVRKVLKRLKTPGRSREELHDFWRSPDTANTPEAYLEGAERSAILVDTMKRFTSSDARVVELGCNVGRNLNALWEAGYRNLTGVEISEAAIAAMKENFPHLNAEIHAGPLEDHVRSLSGDAIFTMAVLEHLHPDSEWVFAEMARFPTIITVEDEREVSERHFPRNYEKVFRSLGKTQVLAREMTDVAGLGSGFWLRVFG